MSGTCYFCNGIVLPDEGTDIVLDGHAGHEVYLHERCGVGANAIESGVDPREPVEVTCPVCGTVETVRV